MKKPLLIILVIIVLLAGGFGVWRMTNRGITFRCADGKSVNVIFHLPEDATVDLALSDGRTMTLPRAISASGARYANVDESFVFWNKGDGAFIEENGAMTFTDCIKR